MSSYCLPWEHWQMHKLSPVSLVECILPLFCRALYPRTRSVEYKRARGVVYTSSTEKREIIQLSQPWTRLWSELQTVKTDTWFFFPLHEASSVDLCGVNVVVLSSPWKPLQDDWKVKVVSEKGGWGDAGNWKSLEWTEHLLWQTCAHLVPWIVWNVGWVPLTVLH